MRKTIRWSTVISLIMIACLAVFETGVFAKKKRKRRSARTTVAQTGASTRYVLPSLLRAPAAPETTVTVDIMNAEPALKALAKRKDPATPAPAVRLKAGSLIISEFR